MRERLAKELLGMVKPRPRWRAMLENNGSEDHWLCLKHLDRDVNVYAMLIDDKLYTWATWTLDDKPVQIKYHLADPSSVHRTVEAIVEYQSAVEETIKRDETRCHLTKI